MLFRLSATHLVAGLSLFFHHLRFWQAIGDKGRQNVDCVLVHLQQLPQETILGQSHYCHVRYEASGPEWLEK